ncbi:MAG: 6-pyruvoyl-tetrahydropterin synthase-related protein, partial [Desulfobacterales bacterium]|nr:6-pyruvoyl-tetrahydropterin synthase-related protein [Desulfobacterales bacterium]
MVQSERSFTLSPWISDIFVLFLLSFLFVNPLFNQHWIITGESIDQLLRVIELNRGIGEGQFYPRWFGDLAGGFGSPYFIFYAPLIYYVSEAFHLLGFGLVTSLKGMIFLGVLMSGVGMYLLTKPFWGSFGALVSGAAYIYVPYRMVDLYLRGDFAEAFAMSLLPFVLYFFYQIVVRKEVHWVLGAVISYAALIFTHNATALIFSGFLLWVLIFFGLQRGSFYGLARGLLGMIWALSLSAVFWLPALLEKGLVNIHLIHGDLALDFRNNFLELIRLFSTTWALEGGPADRNLPFQIGWPHILFVMFSFSYLLRPESQGKKEARQHMLFFLFCVILALFFTNESSRPIWESLPLMKYLQFPWRFLTILSFFISILSGALLLYFVDTPKPIQQVFQIALVSIIALTGLQYCRVSGYLIMSEETMTPEWVKAHGGTVSAYNTSKMDQIRDYGEYLPRSVKKLPDKRRAGQVQVLTGAGRIMDLKRTMQAYEFTVSADENIEIIVGSFYYPSWKGRIEGRELFLFTDDEGLIHLQVPKGISRVRVFFGDSTARKWAKYISLISLLAVLAILFLRIAKNPAIILAGRRFKRGSA